MSARGARALWNTGSGRGMNEARGARALWNTGSGRSSGMGGRRIGVDGRLGSTAGQRPPISTRPQIIGTTIDGKPVVQAKTGNFTVMGKDGKPTVNVIKATDIIPRTGPVKPSHAMPRVMDAGSTEGQRPVRGRPSVPATLPKVTGGGPSGRSPGATLYETPWKRFMRITNKNSSKLGNKGKLILPKVLAVVKKAYFAGKGITGQAMSIPGARSLGTMAMAVILVISYAETVALRIEGKITSEVFWARSAGITAVLVPILIAFGLLTFLITMVLGVVAPFLGGVAIFVGSVIGATFIMNWILKKLGIEDTGPEGDPWTERWGSRGERLSVAGRKMMAEEFSKGGTLLSKLAGGFIANAGDVIRFIAWSGEKGTSVLQKVPGAINTLVGVNAQQDSREALAKRKGFSNFAAYEKSTPQERREALATLNTRNKPQQTLLGKSALEKVLKRLKRSRNKTLTSLDFFIRKGDKPSALKFTKELSKQNAAISLLEAATLNDEGTHYVMATTQIINAPSNSLAIQKRSSQNISEGHNISINEAALGLYP